VQYVLTCNKPLWNGRSLHHARWPGSTGEACTRLISLDLSQWFVLALEPQRERIALLGLHQRNVTAWMPMAIIQRRMRGRLTEVRRPLLGPYTFVRSHEDELSALVLIPGIRAILPPGRAPECVQGHVVDNLRVRELAGEFRFTDTVTGRRKRRKVLRSLRELGLWQEMAEAA
jgi:hypothetical protein